MRLRYLHLKNYPPISDITVCFASGSLLARECAIRFVVGLNGSGKSNLLRAVAEVFLALADLRPPAFPVSLVYELGIRGRSNHYTFVVDSSGRKSKTGIWLAENWCFPDGTKEEFFSETVSRLRELGQADHFRTHIAQGAWPQEPGIAMPKAVLAYTTGDLSPWRSVWSRNQDAQDLLVGGEEGNYVDERPAGWTVVQELALQAVRQDSEQHLLFKIKSQDDRSNLYRRPVLLDSTLIKCALLAVTLRHAFVETGNNHDPLQELFNRGGWHHLVSVSFHSRMQTTHWNQNLCKTAHDWWLCASEVIAEPHPVEPRRTVWFDLKGSFDGQKQSYLSSLREELKSCRSQGETLWTLLGGGGDASSFELFSRLLELNQAGLFDNVSLRLRRQTRPDAGTDVAKRDIGILRYEELSDGEQMVLGRMALFHLLEGQHDSLLLLDEPETHFNDLWKRDVVSVVDAALGKTSCEVVVATHAALVLTDALKDELVVLERAVHENSATSSHSVIRILDNDIHTFGATGDHPLRDIFGAPDTVGRRASRILEVLIAAATLADQIEPRWAGENTSLGDDIVDQVWTVVAVTEPAMTKVDIREALNSIVHFAEHFGAERPLTMQAVLEAFIRQTGPGYFQVELKRAWRRLLKEDGNVTQA